MATGDGSIELDVALDEDESEAGKPGDQQQRRQPAERRTTAAGDAEEPVEVLRQQLDESRRQVSEFQRREAQAAQTTRSALDERDKAVQRASAAEASSTQADLTAVANALEAEQRALAGMKVALKSALADGKYDEVADLQEKIGRSGARVELLQDGKADIEHRIQVEAARRREQAERQRRQPERPAVPADPVDAFIAGVQAEAQRSGGPAMSPRAQAYIRAHPEFVTDRTTHAKMMAAHYAAEAAGKGEAQNADAYFDHLDQAMGWGKHAGGNGAERQQQQEAEVAEIKPAPQNVQRRAAASAAPVSRDAPSLSGQPRRMKVVLTNEEQEFCKMNDISLEGYAREKAKLTSEGRIGPNAPQR